MKARKQNSEGNTDNLWLLLPQNAALPQRTLLLTIREKALVLGASADGVPWRRPEPLWETDLRGPGRFFLISSVNYTGLWVSFGWKNILLTNKKKGPETRLGQPGTVQ